MHKFIYENDYQGQLDTKVEFNIPSDADLTDMLEEFQNYLKAIGFSDEELKDTKAYRGKGCDKCMDSGVKGRRAIHEVLVVTKNLKEAILAGKNDLELGQVAQEKDGFVTMQEVGKRLIKEGVITVEEFKRILMVED